MARTIPIPNPMINDNGFKCNPIKCIRRYMIAVQKINGMIKVIHVQNVGNKDFSLSPS